MESSENQIIINTKDASGVIRNINYSPDRNISIINTPTSIPGSDVNFTDAVTLDFLNKTVALTINSIFNNLTLNSQYGIINVTFNSGPSGNGGANVTLSNSFITTSSIVHFKCINYSGTIATNNTFPIIIIKGVYSGYCDFIFSPLVTTPLTGTTIKYFFYIY